ncbi:MAG: hypothetical protein HN368_01900, partial [Spirochaetales bacterium]|nr:hypothetical protein [Spirochaetales bacterium]
DDPFFGFGVTYSFSPDESALAYIGEEDGGFGLHLYQSGAPSSSYLPAFGEITGRTQPKWSPDGSFLVYSAGSRIWVYDVENRDAWIVTEPSEEYLEDINPWFADDGWSIFFYRGTTFEYSFAGDLFNVGIDGKGLIRVDEEQPKHPGEDLSGFGFDDPYLQSVSYLLESRIALFILDLENHDYERILSYYAAWYVIGQQEFFGPVDQLMSLEMFNLFFFNGALMYDDYGNTITQLSDIVRVVEYEIQYKNMQVHLTVELDDGRNVGFNLMFDQETLQFSGPFG